MREESKAFFLYKGLKKPLVFKGLKGKYIYQAGGAFAGTLVLAIILSNIIGFLTGLLVAVGLGGGLVWDVFRRQKTKGLYNRNRCHDQIHLMPSRIKLKQVYEKERF